ncbi:hypothetical protein [Alienimonas chondri]|uniref:TIGR02588 family protein n=1 Tax=Alienimonas chondri TaxID=2681879 RepID=A0ABX1VCK7_9PLAN|nr:hypothetical protein [Alienimonas chondri]NNJ25784.1 hypothetical protein [Alienimonas chondri]
MTAPNSDRKNALEWGVFALGALLVAATVGCLVFEWVRQGNGAPPAPTVRLGTAEPRDGVFAVPVTVENKGGSTAEGVRVEVTLVRPGEPEERASFTVAFLPGDGTREGWVTFSTDPADGRLEGRAVGYEQP